MSLLDFRIEDAAVKYGICWILLKKGNDMIRGLIFKIFPVFGFGKILNRS